MFLRRYERRSGRRKRTYWALAESIRTKRGSRQRIVAYLGELAASEQSGWAQLGRSLSGKQRPQPSLFDPPHYDDPSDDEPVLVNLNGIRLERLRDFGDVWMALGLWRLLGLDSLLQNVAEPGREEVPWPVVAAILTIARFCKPASELHIETTWYRGTALEDLLGVSLEKVYTDRLYAGLDWLLPHKSQIEKHLKKRLGSLFDLEYDLLLYDVTSTYFEGAVRGQRPCETRLFARRPARLPASLHRAGGDDRRHSAGLRGLRRQPPRLDHGGRDRRGDGAEIRPGQSRLGDGPRHGERGKPAIPAATEGPIHRGHAQGDAAAIRGVFDSQGLARSPGGRRGSVGSRTGRRRKHSSWPGARIAAKRKRRCTNALSIGWKRRSGRCRPRPRVGG